MEHLQTQGISLPRLGLGTFRMQGDTCRVAVESALGEGSSFTVFLPVVEPERPPAGKSSGVG